MSLYCLSSISPILYSNQTGFSGSGLKTRVQNVRCIEPIPTGILTTTSTVHRKPHSFRRDFLVTQAVKTDDPKVSSFGEEEIKYDCDWGDEEDEGSPWEGAIVYRRNASITHVEYCTTLERLGLGKISSELSRSRASIMGIRVTKDVKDFVDGTPVLVSIDITRRKRKLRVDGIIRTVITLACNRCGEPAAESVYSNFSLLLTEEQVDEPDTGNFGTLYGEGNSRSTLRTAQDEEDEDDASIDIEDRLYFPPECKEIDISKQVRDLIHLEITITAICDSKCKGVCLQCGTDLNISSCDCGEQEIFGGAGIGPLGNLKKQMQRK